MAESKTTAQSIEQLRKRYEELNRQQIEAGANFKNATEHLNNLKSAAMKEHGTDDLEKLRVKLKEMEAENEKKRSDYQIHLDKIETDLKEADAKFSQQQVRK